jgi:hypothetical protein
VTPEGISNLAALRVVKLVHTLAWAFFSGCIVAIPYFAWKGRLETAYILIAIVMFEVSVLVANGMKCPLTAIAARYTDDRRDNFDIYLPLLLARYNKHIFGALFVAGIAYVFLLRHWE